MTTAGNFADRFYWARHRAGVGAPTIAKSVGCSQGLVSVIERGNRGEGSESSEFNDKFAKLFGVSASWLRSGDGRAPEGFDPKIARKARAEGSKRGVPVAEFGGPRWAEGVPAETEDRSDFLQKRIFSDFQEYAPLVGGERTGAFIEVLTRLATLVGATPGKKA